MSYTTINKSSLHMNTKLYTGTGSSNSVTGVGFQPDWVWIKDRGSNANHHLFDAVRGVTKDIISNSSNAQGTDAQKLTAFGADGFTVGTNGNVNGSSANMVSWNWKAGTGQGSSNTDGSINTTYTSVNTTSGFSISQYTGTGSNATIGHGLGAVPKMIIVKNTSTTDSWMVYHVGSGSNAYLHLETTNAALSPSTAQFQATTPTSSLFYVGTADGTNKSSSNMIAYCFAEKTGYSKFGSYTGNGNADGKFIYTGFKPAFVLFKGSTIAENWWMFDTKRSESNVANDGLIASTSNSEYSNNATFKIDILSNGFKMRSTDSFANSSGNTYIFMCFAEAPLVGSNNVPCTAR